MNELFEFVIYKKDKDISDSYIENFITNYLDKNSLFWGGGYDASKINGVISTEKSVIEITSILTALVEYFSSEDSLEVMLFTNWSQKINRDTLAHYRNLKISKSNTQN